MTLQTDINAGLTAISDPNASPKLILDKSGSCFVTVPIPDSVAKLTDNQLIIKIQISRTKRYFSLTTMIAKLNGTPNNKFLEALFHRQFYADQVSGVSLAINAEQNTLVSIYHWMIDSISPTQFSTLFQNFSLATLDIIKEVGIMAKKERQVMPFHKT